MHGKLNAVDNTISQSYNILNNVLFQLSMIMFHLYKSLNNGYKFSTKTLFQKLCTSLV